MEVTAFQELVISDLSSIKTTQESFNERLNETCTKLASVETTQTNFLESHKKEINASTYKKFKVLGLIIGIPSIIFQAIQYGGLI